MKTGDYEMEMVREIWNKHGESIEVGPDRDGIDLVEIRAKNAKGEITYRFSFAPDQAHLVADAMKKCATEIVDEQKYNQEMANASKQKVNTTMLLMRIDMQKAIETLVESMLPRFSGDVGLKVTVNAHYATYCKNEEDEISTTNEINFLVVRPMITRIGGTPLLSRASTIPQRCLIAGEN